MVAMFYDPTADRWSAGPSVISAGSAFGIPAVRLSNGKVLVLLSSQSVLFDPGGTSTPTAPEAAAPFGPAANPLNSSRTTPHHERSVLLAHCVGAIRTCTDRQSAAIDEDSMGLVTRRSGR